MLDRNEYSRRWRRANKERVAAYSRKWYWNNREKAIAKGKRRYRLNKDKDLILARQRLYGLSKEQYDAMASRQAYRCAICKEEKPLVVDHNHDTKVNRGLLCGTCNAGIGMFYERVDSLRNAIEYLSGYANANMQ